MPRFDKDYYRILGVPETAAPGDVRKAYRALAKTCHPDLSGGDKAKERRFKEINEAHEVLADPEKRAQYDRMRQAGASPTGGGAGFDPAQAGGMGDLFSSFFDLGAMGRHAQARSRRERGEDTAFRVAVPFETAARGGRITITLPMQEACPDCSGTGARGGASGKACRACRGTGMTGRSVGGFAFSRPCGECGGRGTEPAPACASCHGEGSRPVTRRLEVKIPAGVSTGSKVRLAGEGAPGANGGPAGDCLLELAVEGHPEFEREGRDVTGDLEIGLADALLGTDAAANTLHGKVTVRIPPGTQPGARLRLAGQGVQGPDGEAGDHYVRVKVRLPRTLTEEQRKALEAFR